MSDFEEMRDFFVPLQAFLLGEYNLPTSFLERFPGKSFDLDFDWVLCAKAEIIRKQFSSVGPPGLPEIDSYWLIFLHKRGAGLNFWFPTSLAVQLSETCRSRAWRMNGRDLKATQEIILDVFRDHLKLSPLSILKYSLAE
jgi:hypothetical protein